MSSYVTMLSEFNLSIATSNRSTLILYTTLFRSAGAETVYGSRWIVENTTDAIHRVKQLASDHDQLIEESQQDRKSTRLNSSHVDISFSVFCFKKNIIILMIKN